MHSLLEGVSIVMFSRTHCTKSDFGYVHRSHGCRLILCPNMFVLWHACTLRSGAKSTPLAEVDDTVQAATLLPNIPSSSNGRQTVKTMLTLHRTDLRLFFNDGRRPRHSLVDEYLGTEKQMVPAFIGW